MAARQGAEEPSYRERERESDENNAEGIHKALKSHLRLIITDS